MLRLLVCAWPVVVMHNYVQALPNQTMLLCTAHSGSLPQCSIFPLVNIENFFEGLIVENKVSVAPPPPPPSQNLNLAPS